MEKLNCSVYDVSDSVEEMIKEGAQVPIYVTGSSMNPFLVSRRDVVWIRSCCSTDLKKGTIVLFKRNDNSLVLHRIIKVSSDDNIVVNGDAQTWSETIEKKQIIGAVSIIERKGKKRDAESFYWVLRNHMWQFLTPFRSVIMKIWFKINRIKRKM